MPKEEWLKIFPAFIALLCFIAGAYLVGSNSIRSMHRAHVEFVANEFIASLQNYNEALSGLFDLEASVAQREQVSAQIPLTGSLYAFRIFDQNGRVVLSSDISGDATFAPANDIMFRGALGTVRATGRPMFELIEGVGDQPQFYSHSILPLQIEGAPRAYIETLIDDSKAWPALNNSFTSTALAIIILFVLAASIPIVLYMRRAGQLKVLASRLNYSSEFDSITNVYNRTAFLRRAEILLRGFDLQQEKEVLTIFQADLRSFKVLNETYGSAIGDQVLGLAASRLKNMFGEKELIGRIGGDTFGIVCRLDASNQDEIEAIGKAIRVALGKPYSTAQGSIDSSAAVGFAMAPRDGYDLGEVLRASEVALDSAKSSDGTGVVTFTPLLGSERFQRQHLEMELRHALASNSFELNFQPFWHVKSGKPAGFETLLRLKGRDGKYVSPAKFVPVAEELGMINEIGSWVLNEACKEAASWPKPLKLSVNMSPNQFANGRAVSAVSKALGLAGLDPHRLEIEIVENLLLSNCESIMNDLERVSDLGVSIALDDFGTGYSSLSYLWQFRFDKLKIDKTLVDNLGEEGHKSLEILSTVMGLAKSLNMEVTAEGVETDAQAKVLRSFGCEYFQGYLFARPMAQKDLPQFFAHHFAEKSNIVKHPASVA